MSRGVEELEGARARIATAVGVYGRSLEIRGETGSTNDDAREAAERGVARGHVVVADAQRAGRGARGSVWSSPGGTDLYVSIVERLTLAPRALSVLTLAVGLGVRDACVALLAGASVTEPVLVKWPNDVRVGRRKCAGILVESSTIGERAGPIVIGIGLDVNRVAFPDELAASATSLRVARAGSAADEAGSIDRGLALATLLACVEARVDALVRAGPEETVASLRPHLALVGERVQVDAETGVLDGIDDDGALRLRQDDGRVRALRSGTLRALTC